ncbi:hypothetical protein V492_01488 [Pseudogymnoascus sp. VKM F-4246]|nr:hypothetical protein V492_01488 [Pseudogymnoascus sp. VKM F-4246]
MSSTFGTLPMPVVTNIMAALWLIPELAAEATPGLQSLIPISHAILANIIADAGPIGSWLQYAMCWA